MQGLGKPFIEELLVDWFDSLLAVEEQYRFLGWQLGVSLYPLWSFTRPSPEPVLFPTNAMHWDSPEGL